ncbi:hypothetical protein GQ54DRAFT_298178 [Martensiomyces pterosporus]|nr:hypothetical protein GQ54DRAFT_298178 [Martensiomyces pterosporus]
MDEDEKDMLSEARARLANTQGKKAKRKARERQLEEARRLATLQKRRELKAAGVEVKKKKKVRHMDYNAEIPFETKAVPGFYDTTEELSRASSGPDSLKGRFLDSLETKSRLEREDDVRKEAKRKRDNKGKGPGSVAFVRASDQRTVEAFAAKEEAEQVSKRKKLVLPSPQVDDAELETIAKLGQQGSLARELVGTDGGGSSGSLLGNYSETPSAIAARTPRTPAQSNRIMNEALAQRAMAAQATPLLGGEASGPVPVGPGTGFHGTLPRGSDKATPNPLASSLRQAPAAPAGGPHGAHPVRDELGLNTPVHGVESTPRERKMAGRGLREQLARKLASLPKPKNEFEIVVPQVEEAASAASADDGGQAATVEDQADVERRQEQTRAAALEAELRRRSKCVQLNLPRPSTIPAGVLPVVCSDSAVPSSVLELISSEMRSLILHDARRYPVPGVPPLRASQQSDAALDDIPDSLLSDARALVDREMESSPPETHELFSKLGAPLADDAWCDAESAGTWLPQAKRFVSAQSVSSGDWIEKHRLDLSHRRELMAAEAARATKVERKLGVVLGGYQTRSRLLDDKIASAYKEFEQTKLDTEAFGGLYASEQAIIPARIQKAEEELRSVEARESHLQSEYQALLDRRNALAAELAR